MARTKDGEWPVPETGCKNCGSAAAGEDGLCKPCRIERDDGPEAKRRYYRDLGRKGGYASGTGQEGLDPEELPELETFQDAKLWLEAIGRATATGRLKDRSAQAAIRAVEAWLKAEDDRLEAEQLNNLMSALAEWKKTGDPDPVLELVE